MNGIILYRNCLLFYQEKNPSLGISGVSHAMELAYLFDYSDWLKKYDYYTTIPDPGRSDANLYRVAMGAWTQVNTF